MPLREWSCFGGLLCVGDCAACRKDESEGSDGPKLGHSDPPRDGLDAGAHGQGYQPLKKALGLPMSLEPLPRRGPRRAHEVKRCRRMPNPRSGNGPALSQQTFPVTLCAPIASKGRRPVQHRPQGAGKHRRHQLPLGPRVCACDTERRLCVPSGVSPCGAKSIQGIAGDRASEERELQMPFPIGAGRSSRGELHLGCIRLGFI
jgi:hypothetical protein